MLDKGKIAITGAGQGLGLAVAVEFLKRGYPVQALILLENQRQALLDASLGLPGELSCEVLDVTAPGSFEFSDDLLVLINNAGIRLKNLPVESIGLEEWRRYMEVNFFGAVELCRRAIPVLRARGQGVICNINSGSSAMPFPFLGPYRASKGAMGQFSETLRAELYPFGIRVMEILPGGVDTGLTATSMGANKTAAAELPDYAPMAEGLLKSFAERGMQYISAQEAAVRIADAILDGSERMRYGTDEYSTRSIERWRSHEHDQAMLGWIKSISPVRGTHEQN
ncbi:SDR family NAD(P)-dependent oxidoreductase [Pseudomonas sp. PDM31]|uniref:SDR family NAD(P)-dependent oxidoreductase n=1 Tax=Pseudomonas sp. PDM31 TaxID=2854778 RepID=UPI001C43B9E1|nr:SDR family NAD(P)-dependent oxidoreductase [Pseudomonas sp. PDM31]MBV7477619.1 SDR family NAD(P)-dependent oxidoreductase [Pseudomonas sp. PDM31]